MRASRAAVKRIVRQSRKHRFAGTTVLLDGVSSERGLSMQWRQRRRRRRNSATADAAVTGKLVSPLGVNFVPSACSSLLLSRETEMTPARKDRDAVYSVVIARERRFSASAVSRRRRSDHSVADCSAYERGRAVSVQKKKKIKKKISH